MITQVEDFGKPGRCPMLVAPGAILFLVSQKILDASSDVVASEITCSHQTQQCPSRLGSRAGPLAFQGGIIITLRRFPPPPIAVLHLPQPTDGGLCAFLFHVFAAAFQASQSEPRSVDVITPPPAVPGSVYLLLPVKEFDGF